MDPGWALESMALSRSPPSWAGLLAGAVGTVCLDAVNYVKYRRTGGNDSLLAWEFPQVDSWDQAPDPGQVGKRLIAGFTQRELPERWAGPVSTVMHWSYGSAWGALYGVLAGSLRRPNPLYGLPLGAVVWISGYILLPEGGRRGRACGAIQPKGMTAGYRCAVSNARNGL